VKVLDLFSGIGGFSLGLESTGFFETVAFCEKDDFCKKVLQKHWGDIKIYDDIRSIDDEIQADVITGGFPCQSFSQAGLQKGRSDDRFLWNEMFDVIKKVKPRWVIGENVQGIINIEQGMVLKQVQDDLEGIGFEVQCIVIPASGIGAWHQRKRVWIIANSKSKGLSGSRGQKGSKNKNRVEQSQTREQGKVWSKSERFGGTSNDVPNTDSIRHRGRDSKRCKNEEWTFLPREQEGGEVGSKTKRCSNVSDTSGKRYKGHNFKQIKHDEKFRQSTSSNDAKRETWWETQSRICGVPNGVSYGVDRDRAKRIKALGNSIVPQIARQLGLAIMGAENES
tara:strand:+ start:268 stop:1278 length:1011 start_codon:yes stop_codon:yes gene_type:complete